MPELHSNQTVTCTCCTFRDGSNDPDDWHCPMCHTHKEMLDLITLRRKC